MDKEDVATIHFYKYADFSVIINIIFNLAKKLNDFSSSTKNVH